METIKDIKPIERSPEFVCHRDFLNEIVELPCLEACFSLYDKNIQTHMSSANLKDKIAYIDIVYESLDDNNKKIAEQLAAKDALDKKVTNYKPLKVRKSIIKK